MRQISDLDQLLKLKTEGAVFVLFGGEHCNVCHSLRPRLNELLVERFPLVQAIYIDCEESPDICAQFSVFSLPTVKVFIENMLITEDSRTFGLNDLMQRIERSYSFWIKQGKHS